MNLLHLKYAVEICETGSMTKAAENLYTSQPNLSRAIKELETALGITIFNRTSKGIFPTAEGDEFLGYARTILSQVDAVEKMYQGENKRIQKFSISVPRASYIACAFTEFTKETADAPATEIFYKETNSMRAVHNILNSDYKLGILRYQLSYEKNFNNLIEEKGLVAETICEFKYVLIMSEKHPLAKKEKIFIDDLSPYTEIAHADPFVPSMPLSTVKKNETNTNVDKRIFVFERASQMDILEENTNSFMWVSPVPKRLLKKYNLIERPCEDNTKVYKDVLIRKQDYTLSDLDKKFIEKLKKYKKEFSEQTVFGIGLLHLNA